MIETILTRFLWFLDLTMFNVKNLMLKKNLRRNLYINITYVSASLNISI